MKKITMLFFTFICAIGFSQSKATVSDDPNYSQNVQLPAAYYNSTAVAVGEVAEGMTVNTQFDPGVRIPYTGTYYSKSPDALVYDNGPYFNVAGPPDISFLQDATLLMGTYGFAAQFVNGFSMADDVVLTADYDITSIDVFAYQTGSSAPSITAVYLQVWDGDPSGGSASVIWGDLTTNIISDAQATDAFRQLESAPGDTAREIQRVTANTTGLSLTAGTYWIDYTFEGSGASGPWAPPIVITGVSATGNALQSNAGVYAPVIDVDGQGMPFQMFGDLSGGGGAPCSEMNPSNGFEDGYTSSSNTPQVIAADLTVAADQNMSLTTVTTNFLMTDGDTLVTADITVYGDAGGVPDTGNIISVQPAVIPSSQTVIGDFPPLPTLDVSEVVFDLAPVALAGQSGLTSTYWVSVYVTTSSAGSGYWEYSTASIVGNGSAFSSDAGVTWNSTGGSQEQVYLFEGDCSPLLGLGENSLEGFSFSPNPTSDIVSLKSVNNIESVSIFNLLGQKVSSSTIGATTSEISLAGLAVGTYIMKVTVNGQIGTYKVIKK